MECESFEGEIQKIQEELGQDFKDDLATKLIITREDLEKQRSLVSESLGDGYSDKAIDRVIQGYYKDPDGAVDLLLSLVKDKNAVQKEDPDN